MIFLLPLAAAVVWSAIMTVHEREAEVEEQAKSIAATSAAYLNQYLDGLGSLALALSKHPDIRALHEPESNSLLADTLKDQPLLLNVLLLGPDGVIHGSAVPLKLRDTLHLPDLLKVASTGRPVISDLTFGRTSGRPSVALGYPVFDGGGKVSGVLSLSINLSRLQEAFASIPLPPGSVAQNPANGAPACLRNGGSSRPRCSSVPPIKSGNNPRTVPINVKVTLAFTA